MPIPVQCVCGRSFKAKDEHAGKRGRCPGCGQVLEIPTPEPGEDEILGVLLADDPPGQAKPSAVRAEPPREPADWRPPREPSLPRREDVRALKRKAGPPVVFEQGWFGSLNAGVIGGLLMILIAVVWFVAGLAAGIIFFYPPILFVLGIVALVKGATGSK
jgi:hypothetical protein